MGTDDKAKDFWVFGYGSVIWAPDFRFEERTRARLKNYKRWFAQASGDHRGTPENPGIVVTLLDAPGDDCWGVAYRVSPDHVAPTLARLDYREKQGYRRQKVPLEIEVGDQTHTLAEATTFLAPADNTHFRGELPAVEVATIAAAASGPSGSNEDYVRFLARALRELDIVDTHVMEVERELDLLRRNEGA